MGRIESQRAIIESELFWEGQIGRPSCRDSLPPSPVAPCPECDDATYYVGGVCAGCGYCDHCERK